MRDFFRSLRFKILLGILLVLFGFMIAAVYSVGIGPAFSQVVSLVTVPAQRISADISDSVSEFFQRFTDSSVLFEENQMLREERSRLLAQMAEYERLRHENEQFRQIIGMARERRDFEMIPASVIARDPAGRFYSFTIDRGTLDNIRPFDPVVTAEGLVGYVSEVGLTYAKVLTILDTSVSVGVYSSATRDIGLVSGDIVLAEQGLNRLEYLDRESLVTPGDIILTSGGSIFPGSGSIFPRDLLIGTVLRVEPSAYGTSLTAVLQPAVDIPGVTDVFVVIDFDGRAGSDVN